MEGKVLKVPTQYTVYWNKAVTLSFQIDVIHLVWSSQSSSLIDSN